MRQNEAGCLVRMRKSLQKMKSIMKSIILMASVVVSFAVQAVTYLKPLGVEEVRATEDGQSWATAYSTVQAAVDAIADEGCADKTIYAAQGVYIFSTKIENLPSDFKIYGGFAGKSDAETLADRNVDAYQTIFTGDATLNDTWQRRVPTFGQHAVVTSDTNLKIIVDGKVNLPPAFAEGEDFVSYAIVFRNNTVSTAFSVAGSSMATLMDCTSLVLTPVRSCITADRPQGSPPSAIVDFMV